MSSRMTRCGQNEQNLQGYVSVKKSLIIKKEYSNKFVQKCINYSPEFWRNVL